MYTPQSEFRAFIASNITGRLTVIIKLVAMLAVIPLFAYTSAASEEAPPQSYLATSNIQLEIFVAPDGEDSNEGTLGNPLGSIQAARDRASTYLNENPSATGAIVIYLRGGVYEQDSTIVFGPEHSGRPASPVIYTNYGDERAVISGGKEITGTWSPVDGKPYYSMGISEAASGNWKFNNLYVNGENRTRARTPNYDEKVLRANGRVARWNEDLSLRFWEGDIDPDWSHLENIDIVIPMTWTPVHHRIETIDFDRRGVMLASAGGQHQLYGDEHFRYYLSNVFEGLDVPGEWYLNPDTGFLYYYPYPDENLEDITVVAPVISSRLLSFEGDAAENETISHIEFNGLEFRYTDTDRDKWNGVYRQAHAFLDAAIYAEGLTHSHFYDCSFENLGEYAIELEVGSQDNTIFRCLFRNLGGGGIQIGISTLQDIQRARNAVGFVFEDKETHPRTDVLRNTIENSILTRVGTYWSGSYAINNRFASYTKVVHNEIFDTHYTAVAVDARWSDYSGENYAHGNEFAYNSLHHIGRGMHSDGGGFYQFGPTDNYYHHNVIADLTAYPHRNEMKGIFWDQQSQGALAENNLIHDIEGGGLVQNWGLGNVFRNNIVAFTEGGASKGKVNPDDASAFNHLYVYSNAFISNDGIGLGETWPKSQEDDIIRDNLFHDLSHDTVTFWGMSLGDWQAQSGLGEGTLIADPGAADPLQRDFTIATRNAALQQIGFVPFSKELEKAGLYGSDDWTRLPQELAVTIRDEVPHWTRSEIQALENRSDPDVIPEGTIHPEADALVRGGSVSDTNFGSEPFLQVSGTDQTSATRQSYLRFDLSSIDERFTDATLRLKLASARSEDPHNAHFVSDDDWAESGITWDNKPTPSEEIDSDLIPENGSWLELDVTEAVRQEGDGDQMITIAVVSSGAGAAHYYSREETTDYVRPQLVIAVSNPGAVVLERDCAVGESWETGDVWSDGEAAGAGKEYLVNGRNGGPVLLRTPDAVNPDPFPGDSLTLEGGGILQLTPSRGGEVTVSELIVDDGHLVSAYPDSTVRLEGAITVERGGLLLEGTPGPLVINATLIGSGPITQEGEDRETTFASGTWGGDLTLNGGVFRFGYGVVLGRELSINNAVFDLNGQDHIFTSLDIDGTNYAAGTYTSGQLGETVVGSGTLTIRDTSVVLLQDMTFSTSWDVASYWSNEEPANSDGDYVVDGSVARMLRTPHNMGQATFPGNSLIIKDNGGIWIKSASGGEVTFPNLISDGGRIVSSYDNSTVTFHGLVEVLAGGLKFEGTPGPLIVEASLTGSGPITHEDPGRDTTLTAGSWGGDIHLLEGTLRFDFDLDGGKRFHYEGGTFDLNGRNHTFDSVIIDGSSLDSGVYTSAQLGDGFTGSGTMAIGDATSGSQWGPYPVDSDGVADTESWMGRIFVEYGNWAYSYRFEDWLWIPEPASAESGGWIFIPEF